MVVRLLGNDNLNISPYRFASDTALMLEKDQVVYRLQSMIQRLVPPLPLYVYLEVITPELFLSSAYVPYDLFCCFSAPNRVCNIVRLIQPIGSLWEKLKKHLSYS